MQPRETCCPVVSWFVSGPVWLLVMIVTIPHLWIVWGSLSGGVWDLFELSGVRFVRLIGSCLFDHPPTHCCQVKPRQVGFVQSWLCWPFSLLTPFFWGISGMGESHWAQRSRQLKMVNHTVKTVGLLYETITLWWLLIWGHMLLWYKWATTVWGDARIMTLAAAYKQLQYIIPHHLCSVAAAQKKTAKL